MFPEIWLTSVIIVYFRGPPKILSTSESSTALRVTETPSWGDPSGAVHHVGRPRVHAGGGEIVIGGGRTAARAGAAAAELEEEA